jgi:hypothetical protein
MAEFKLGRIRFIWKDVWTPTTAYLRDDVVRNGGKTFVCVAGHTSATLFTTDVTGIPTKWNQVSDGTEWKSNWATNTYYNENDLVKYGGIVYICNTPHTSAATTLLGIEDDLSSWTLYATSFDWKSDWEVTTRYKANDVVRYSGRNYLCNVGHTSSATTVLGLEADQSNWDLFTDGFTWTTNWSISTRYKVNDVVKYGGQTYVCNVGHTSSATTALGLEADQSKWDSFHKGINYLGQWSGDSVRYKINDLVNYGADVWICTAYHTSATVFNESVWARFVEGLTYENTWSNSTVYQPGDIVGYGGYSYISKTINSNKTPTANLNDWSLFTTGLTFIGDWNTAQSYLVGDVLRNGAYTYVVTADHTSSAINQPPNISYWSLLNSGIKWANTNKAYTSVSGTNVTAIGSDATFDVATAGTSYTVTINTAGTGYTADTTIKMLGTQVGGISPFNDMLVTITAVSGGAVDTVTVTGYASTWAPSVNYVLGDSTSFGPNSYICIVAHTSASGNRPDVDILGEYWNLVAAGAQTSVLSVTGDIPYMSQSGPTRLAIGAPGQVLKVSSSLLPSWGYFGVIDQIYYVSQIGTNQPAPEYGMTLDRPWLTVRYAADQITQGPLNPNAKYFLTANRAYIQKEVIGWINDQITNNTAPFTSAFTYNAVKCERDIGYVIDALAYDLSHGGNSKVVAVAQSYVSGAYTLLGTQSSQDVAGYNYMVSVINAVIASTAPETSYQATVTRVSNTSKPVETGVVTLLSNLVSVITSAITAGVSTNIPSIVSTTYTIFVKTGIYYETLPIIVPNNTSIVGDELRSTNIRPAPSLIASNDKAKSMSAVTYIKSITPNIITKTAVSSPYQITVPQDLHLPAGSVGSADAVASVLSNVNVMYGILNSGLVVTPAFTYTDPTGYDTGFLNARRLINANAQFLKDEVTAFMVLNYNDIWSLLGPAGQASCTRDVGYIVDALYYDLTYGTDIIQCNLATSIVARSYYSNSNFVEPSTEKIAALAVQARIKSIIDSIAQGTSITRTTGNTTTQNTSGAGGSTNAGTVAQNRIQEIYDTINTGISPTVLSPSTSWVSSDLIAANSALQSAKSQIQLDCLAYVKAHNATLVFNQATCSRDVGYIIDALGYDLMFGSNFLSCQTGMSYYRAVVSAQIVISGQKSATLGMLEFLKHDAAYIAASGASVLATKLWDDVILNMSGNNVPTAGSNFTNLSNDAINGAYQLIANADFLAAESVAYINTLSTSVTASSTSTFTCIDTSWMAVGDKITFTGTLFGGVSLTVDYFIHTIVDGVSFRISTTLGGTTTTLVASTGSMTVKYVYDQISCARDMKLLVLSVANDIINIGNYSSQFNASCYSTAVTGSLASDMFYVRNSTGIRNLTVQGLTGTLSSTNGYGTKRPTAGAYVSLDPGWGPNDTRGWITSRSPYIQNVTTFGTGCVGLKIDGTLHSGGNRSVVANDFTQILSDGIGVWCTGSRSLTELVSVFSYYGYMGYLAENGGKIRATNGNSSYGTYGTVAEGVDIYEIPLSATVNNHINQAIITNVITNAVDKIYSVEFLNAGTNYNTAIYSFSGTGYGVESVANEFRDNGVFESRLLSNGKSYVSVANVGQFGTTTSITIGAVDLAINSTYIGMRVQITSGLGVGQYAYIVTYNSGTKVARVAKDNFATIIVTGTTDTTNVISVPSTATLYVGMPIIFTGTAIGGLASGIVYYVIAEGFTSTQFSVSTVVGGTAVVLSSVTASSMTLHAAGWEHVIMGTPILAALDVTTGYVIEPRVQFASPGYSATARTQQNDAWIDSAYGDINTTYTAVAVTGGTGTGATFNVVKTGVAYAVTLAAGGTGYVSGDVLTIIGTALGGANILNNITITVTKVLSGVISNFTYTGLGAGGMFVAIAGAGTASQYSVDGVTWVAGGALPASSTWTSLAYGALSGVGTWVAVQNGSTNTAKSTDGGTTWVSAGTLSTTGDWSSVAYGNGKFITVANNSTVANISSNGTVWTATAGALPTSTTWTSVTYGAGVWVVIASAGTSAAYSINNGATWVASALPVAATWKSITYGKGRFVAIASDSTTAAYSLDGITWYQSQPLPASQTWSQVKYGQGLFLAVATGATTIAASSEDGVSWISRTLLTSTSWPTVSFGNPNSTPLWLALSSATTTANSIVCGATAKGRVKVSSGSISEFRILEPGSGYTFAPAVTVTDSNVTVAFTWSVRIGVGVLANPTFISRGTQYAVASAIVSGNGYADMYQSGNYVNISGLASEPIPGSNVTFAGDSTYYKLVAVLNFVGTGGGQTPYNATLQLSPAVSIVAASAHNTALSMRMQYSQVRLTGHDFLGIGTGNFPSTNFPGTPELPIDASKETVAFGGGRVFYTSTDQDGNFTVGNLFSVQQSTGVATLNADAFNIAGLNQLTLGAVTLGGTSATITAFSTDPYFTANSDNIVPTQKAIKSYISSQIGGGGSSLNVNTITAGVVYIAGNTISTTTGVQINVANTMNFIGGVTGSPLAMNFLLS